MAAACRPTRSRCARSPGPTRSWQTPTQCPPRIPAPLAGSLRQVRDAMVAHPEMVGGTRDRLDTSVAKALPGRIAAKGGVEGLRCFAILPGRAPAARRRPRRAWRSRSRTASASDRATSAAAVEALAQAGVLDGQALRVLGRYHRPIGSDPHGRAAAEAVASFELAPVGELVG